LKTAKDGSAAQRRAAGQALSRWLKKETGRPARRLREADAFELHGRRYYCFRYKRSFFSREWLLGVSGGYRGTETEDCGHTGGGFPYQPETARAEAVRLIKARREYWMRQARGIQESEETPSPEVQQLIQILSPGAGRHSFTGSALLNRPDFDFHRLCAQLKEDWDWPASAAHIQRAGSATFNREGILAAVTLVPGPVPDGEAEQYAANSLHWEGAMEAARTHAAHLQIAAMGTEGALETAKVFTQLCASCLTQPDVSAVCTAGAVFSSKFYREEALLLKGEDYPVRDWIYIGVAKARQGFNAYTYGLENFGLPEMEILESRWTPDALEDFLCETARYALRSGRPFHSREAVGFCRDERFLLSRSAGVSVDGMSLKIDVKG
jgi:hypothetical protein